MKTYSLKGCVSRAGYLNNIDRKMPEKRAPSKVGSGGSMGLVKWLAIIVLVILILLALFLPGRGLACAARSLLIGAACASDTSTSMSSMD